VAAAQLLGLSCLMASKTTTPDDEDSDPAVEGEASGIGDQDGLDEQVSFRDWQGVGMV
jgi:hypothetical protein